MLLTGTALSPVATQQKWVQNSSIYEVAGQLSDCSNTANKAILTLFTRRLLLSSGGALTMYYKAQCSCKTMLLLVMAALQKASNICMKRVQAMVKSFLFVFRRTFIPNIKHVGGMTGETGC